MSSYPRVLLAFPVMTTPDESGPSTLYQQAIATLAELVAEATAVGDPEPTAMTLATADASGRVSARIVLLKGIDDEGLRFYTNYASAKGEQLAAHTQAALTLHWKTVRDQVQARVEGCVEKVSAADSDVYFASRPRLSQIGAWASLQSQDLPDRATFDARVHEFEQRFEGTDVPRPPHWGGYLLQPDLFEFWYGARFRLHERVRYELRDTVWTRRLLYP